MINLKASSDSVFLRRVYLDLVGMIPTYEETTAFLGDTDPKKRELLIDKLLADPRYARNQAQVWDVSLLGRSPKGIRSTNRDAFRKWLATQFEKNEPYDRIVHKLLTADSRNRQQPGVSGHRWRVDQRCVAEVLPADSRAALERRGVDGVAPRCRRARRRSGTEEQAVRGHGEVSRRTHRWPGKVSGKPDGAPVHSQRGPVPRIVLPAQRQPNGKPAEEHGRRGGKSRADVFVGPQPQADHRRASAVCPLLKRGPKRHEAGIAKDARSDVDPRRVFGVSL